MYSIYKITSDTVVDFAAEELKKYLRMMMPRCGEIKIKYAPDARDGFRLGLMSDFGLDTSDAQNTELDDILYIDCDEQGGIIAGDNARSVLLAVYKYLTINGCRWLFPGIDGELIPMQEIKPVKYRKLADCRYRGQCNEGAEYQPNMMEAIDFTPKIGLNIFMIEFDNPRAYYDRYYNHVGNEVHREPEPVTPDQVLQWKRQCEAELTKRGLQFHDMGHGWTAEAFDIDSSIGWISVPEESVPEESRKYLALLKGERKLFGGIPLNTNFCMSNTEARDRVRKAVVKYAQEATNVDYLHVWLGDGVKNHCECEECKKLRPSDWYVTLMNEIDASLTEKGLKTRLVMLCYYDTTFAPQVVKLNNPDRFSLLLGAISRSYIEPVTENLDTSKIELTPYVRNAFKIPQTVDEYIGHAKQWTEHCHIPALVYEYHYWYAQYRDLGVFDAARIIWRDIKGYKSNGFYGVIEDGSQRSFFPNGFSFYVYASTLFDTSVDFEEIKEDYFSHAYGEDWREVVAFLEKLGQVADFRFMNGKMSLSDDPKNPYYNPEMAESFAKVTGVVDEFAPFVEAHKNMPWRAQTVAYRILWRYLDYCRGIIKPIIYRALGEGVAARESYFEFAHDFGKYELEMERWYDHTMAFHTISRSIGSVPNPFD